MTTQGITPDQKFIDDFEKDYLRCLLNWERAYRQTRTFINNDPKYDKDNPQVQAAVKQLHEMQQRLMRISRETGPNQTSAQQMLNKITQPNYANHYSKILHQAAPQIANSYFGTKTQHPFPLPIETDWYNKASPMAAAIPQPIAPTSAPIKLNIEQKSELKGSNLVFDTIDPYGIQNKKIKNFGEYLSDPQRFATTFNLPASTLFKQNMKTLENLYTKGISAIEKHRPSQGDRNVATGIQFDFMENFANAIGNNLNTIMNGTDLTTTDFYIELNKIVTREETEANKRGTRFEQIKANKALPERSSTAPQQRPLALDTQRQQHPSQPYKTPDDIIRDLLEDAEASHPRPTGGAK